MCACHRSSCGRDVLRKRIKKIAALITATILLWLIVLMVQIHTYADVRDHGPADVAIVLGAAVWRGEPSPVFAARIDHAIDLYREKAVSINESFFNGLNEWNGFLPLHVPNLNAV